MRALSVLLVTAATFAAAAPAADAANVALTFDNAVLDTPATPDAVVVSPEGEPIKATAVVDDATGAFTIDPATFDFPKYSFTDPIAGTIDIILNAPATGKIDLATGQVTLTADFQAQVDVTGLGACNINTGPQLLSTDNKEPLPGQRYPAAGFTVGTSPVALAVSWASLPPGTGPGCTLINPFVGGPGGFWISDGIPPKPATPPSYDVAKLGLSVSPKKATAKSGGTAKFVARIKNNSDAGAKPKFCVKAPKVKKSCRTLKSVAAGGTGKVTYTLPVPLVKKKKSFTVSFTATAKGLKAGKASATLTAKPAK